MNILFNFFLKIIQMVKWMLFTGEWCVNNHQVWCWSIIMEEEEEEEELAVCGTYSLWC